MMKTIKIRKQMMKKMIQDFKKKAWMTLVWNLPWWHSQHVKAACLSSYYLLFHGCNVLYLVLYFSVLSYYFQIRPCWAYTGHPESGLSLDVSVTFADAPTGLQHCECDAGRLHVAHPWVHALDAAVTALHPGQRQSYSGTYIERGFWFFLLCCFFFCCIPCLFT